MGPTRDGTTMLTLPAYVLKNLGQISEDLCTLGRQIANPYRFAVHVQSNLTSTMQHC